jgi:hypothetical protein
VILPIPNVPATGFPSDLFWINSNGNQPGDIKSLGVNDASKSDDGVAYGSGFIDDFGRCTGTDISQNGSL